MDNTEAQPSTELPGNVLPSLTGEYLNGRKANLPSDAKGKVALLLFGFSYSSRFPVEQWAARWEDKYGLDARVAFYEIPMIGGLARLGKPFIDRGMRRGTPPEKHANVITVYSRTGPWKKLLQVTDDKLAYVVLIDAQGVVRQSFSGPYSEAAFNDLTKVVRSLLP